MPTHFDHPPVALSVAGSDCSAGAGIQADLKMFNSYGVYGVTAVTCVVAEVPGRVTAIQPVTPAIVRQQMELCLDAFPVAAMKTGLLHSRAVVELVADIYRARPPGERPPLIVDPVLVATSGDPLATDGVIAAYRQHLFPLAALVTPNLDEARALLEGATIADADGLRAAGQELCRHFGVPFLMKGGHLGGDRALDVLVYPDGHSVELSATFERELSTHGTGCAYSAAIAAGIAMNLGLEGAIRQAKERVTAAIRRGFRWKRGGGHLDALRN